MAAGGVRGREGAAQKGGGTGGGGAGRGQVVGVSIRVKTWSEGHILNACFEDVGGGHPLGM